MNHMRAIAEMLGVEIDEEFCIAKYPKYMTYRLTEMAGLQSKKYNGGWNSKGNEREFRDILTGYAAIIKKPWKPSKGEEYYCVDADGYTVCKTENENHSLDVFNIRCGNCFHTKVEARKNIENFKKWIEKEPDTSWRVKE